MEIERIALSIVKAVGDQGPRTLGAVRRSLASRDRELFPAACAFAIRREWLTYDGDRRIGVGLNAPPHDEKLPELVRAELEKLA